MALAPLASGCETPAAFAVPPGPPRAVAVDVRLPVYVLGNYAVSTFEDALRVELAKYRVAVVRPGSRTTGVVRVDLGQFTYRQWPEIDVFWIGDDGKTSHLGDVHLPDPETSTVQAAAQPVAELVARKVWGVGAGVAARP